jgi:hypothetical protein
VSGSTHFNGAILVIRLGNFTIRRRGAGLFTQSLRSMNTFMGIDEESWHVYFESRLNMIAK